ncbi:MAG TPA: PQQ-binding-like beta-propeller repeat protein [Candidatus Thermoplasmatota archaeon]|nr:PQQ-binding-like beta-propeller repeat protein [Candidatus Thermoplasmatota archaeon]
MKRTMKLFFEAVFCLMLLVIIPGSFAASTNVAQPVQSKDMKIAFLHGTISQMETIGGQVYAHAVNLHYSGIGGVGSVKDAQVSFQSDPFLRHFFLTPQGSEVRVFGFVHNFDPSSEGQVPPDVSQYQGDWPMANKNYENTRATTDSTITATNVAGLSVAWSYAIQGIGPFGGAASTPLIIGNRVVFQDLEANVVVLDRQTGAVLWTKWYNNTAIEGPNGPAIGYGNIYLAKDLYNITALNLSTGAEVWSTRISYVPTTGIDIQPIVYDDMVFISTVPGTGDVFYAPGGIGEIYALNAQTGAIRWNFSTVDSNLWGHPEVNSGGGCWYPPAINRETNTIFWGIANPAPFAGVPGWPSGTSFAGAALFTDCMMALDYQTGKMKWYTQAIAHDIFDHDFQISPILASANVSGIEQKIVIGAGKLGDVLAFNRDTGAILWDVPVGVHENDKLDNLTGETLVYPGVLGGVETCMAYANGIVYVPVVDMSTNYTPTGLNFSSINFAGGKGELVAIDVNLGKILWIKTFNSINVGAATVVNDVVLTATFDGKIYAFQATSGAQLFSFQAPVGINSWPAVAGNMIIWPAGVGLTPTLLAFHV